MMLLRLSRIYHLNNSVQAMHAMIGDCIRPVSICKCDSIVLQDYNTTGLQPVIL